MPYIHNREYLKPFRKSLRNNSTAAEATLWKIVKNKKVGSLKFRRQHSVGKYVLDFYCPELRLAIELDGEPHANPAYMIKDDERDKYLETFSIRVMRYENKWVHEYPDEIINDILNFKNNCGNNKSTNIGEFSPG
jgi:very-short-patch-repair endonuclease